MEPKTKVQQVIAILSEKGWTDEQISQLVTEISKASFNNFYTKALAALSEEDLDLIDKMTDEAEAQVKIKELYKLRTGSDADEEAAAFADAYAQGMLDELAKSSS